MVTRETNDPIRLPIGTLALLLSMCAAFGVVSTTVGKARVGSDAELAKAAIYLLEHPYLDVHPILESYTGTEQIDLARKAFWTARDRRGAPPLSGGLRGRRITSM